MLKSEAIYQLLSLNSYLNQIKDEDYILPLEILKNASVGKHVRHIVEFYECLLKNTKNNSVNYDERKRNLLLETNVKYAIDFIIEIMDNIDLIVEDKKLNLVSSYHNEKIISESSLYREINYNIEHTVHHLAILNIVVFTNFKYIQLNENFGYANSTIQYNKEITNS